MSHVGLIRVVKWSGLAVLHLLWHHVWRHSISTELTKLILSNELRLGLWSHILVWVEATKSHDVGKTRDLEHWNVSLHWREVGWADALAGSLSISLVEIASCFLLLVVFEFFWHWRQSNSFRKVR